MVSIDAARVGGMTEFVSPLKWEPAALAFSVALSKPSMQQLRTRNTSTDNKAYTFKVKTTNPKRYSVRPNVGIAWPGQEVMVTVQLPAMKEYPADMNKCKDKFQVLTLPLKPEQAEKLKPLSTEQQRVELTELWASDDAKAAAIDKIRCTMVFDSSFRGVPIAEEEHPIPPYSPETVPAPPEGAATTPTSQTPYAQPAEATASEPASPTRYGSSVDESSTRLSAKEADLPTRLAAAERSVAELTREKQQTAKAMGELKAELVAAKKSGGGKGGFSLMALLMFVFAAFAAGIAGGQTQMLTLPMVPAAGPTPKSSATKAKGKKDEV